MYVLLLIGCVDDGEDARDRAADFLEEHPTGTAIVRVPIGRPGISAVVGTGWGGEDLAEALAPCSLGEDARFDVELRLESGAYPWRVEDTDGDPPPCVTERLSVFPFEAPSRRAEMDLVHVRWRPGEAAEPVSLREDEPSGLPVGLRALAPPYFRRSPSGDALRAGRDLVIDEGEVRIRPARRSDVTAGALTDAGAWARKLSCDADTLGLVRTVLVFDDGYLEEVETASGGSCVEDRARGAREWFRGRAVDGVPLSDAGTVLVVLDVPMGDW